MPFMRVAEVLQYDPRYGPKLDQPMGASLIEALSQWHAFCWRVSSKALTMVTCGQTAGYILSHLAFPCPRQTHLAVACHELPESTLGSSLDLLATAG